MPNFKVKAVYEYASPHEDDLSFPVGQIITVTEEEDADWYVGEYVDASGTKKDGLFPRNFVEKYEPEPPPRPNRASRHKPLEQPAAAAAPPPPPPPETPQQEAAPAEPEEPPTPKPQPAPEENHAAAKTHISPTSATSAQSHELPKEPPPAPKLEPVAPVAPAAPSAPATTAAPVAPVAAAAAPTAKKAPPPVAAKSNAFRDRIAAFNQPAAAPITPFKPGGGPPSTFIKKPFVAAPPSRNAYIPPPTQAPVAKVYRREEDPEIAERRAQDQENAERAGLTASSPAAAEPEDQPKPMSLKERIAFLQKQQQEQAERAAALQKEKPKKPPKKRTESYEDRGIGAEDAALERVTSTESKERGSMENARPRRSSHGTKSTDVHATNRELLSDANDADQSGAGDTEEAEGTSTSVEDDDERVRVRAPPPAPPRAPAAPSKEPDVGDEQDVEGEEEEEEEEEDEMDAETRRKLELRERMAKMSGGMGMAGMFGAPGGLPMGGLPPKKKKPEKKPTGDGEEHALPQQRFAIPGMSHVRSPEQVDKQWAVEKEDTGSHPITHTHPAEEVPDVEDITPQPIQKTPTGEHPPPLPSDKRPVPPRVPATDRPVPPPIPSASRPVPLELRSPTPGSESGDEMPDTVTATSPKTPSAHPQSKRSSYLASDELSQDSPEKHLPPIPVGSPTMSPTTQSRPPPPPPPTAAPPSRQATMDSTSRRSKEVERAEEETEYEGDYDTDIAPGATHKDALKAHARDSSMEDSTIPDETPRSPTIPFGVPPLPPSGTRAVPPPPPPTQPPSRVSTDVPRGAPPPPPVPTPSRDVREDEEEYDPYRYASPPRAIPPPPKPMPPPPQSQPPPPQNRPRPPSMPPMPPVPPAIPPPSQHQAAEASDEDDLYSSPPRKSHDRPPPPPPQAPPHQHRPPPLPAERSAPPPPPSEPAPAPRAPMSLGRKSLDVNRVVQPRVSTEQPRSSASQDFIATDVDLGASSHWWTQPNMPPPSLQGRKDVLIEMDETREGNTIEKYVAVLYMDYSQTVIIARFESHNVSDVQLEQRQDPPPAKLRQDQLEAAYEQFGARIAKDVEGKQNTIVGDGTPHALIHALLAPYPAALKPVSTRSFGALVYANLANASVQQNDEIRPGDIVTFRNAKFQGKHGAMHAKYSMDVGKPDHVGVVVEWDGSKKKLRAWEQGRESRKCKVDSWRMGDLRSGEVRVWRVMGRAWVGWN